MADFYNRDWEEQANRILPLFPEDDRAIVQRIFAKKKAQGNSGRDLEKTGRDIWTFKKKFFPGKSLSKLTKEDVAGAFSKLYNGDAAYYTITDYRKHIRQFYRELLGDDYNPLHYKFDVNPKLMTRKKKELEHGKDSLTQGEIESLAAACDNWRDKAYIMMSFDTMARVQSILSMQVKDAIRDEHGEIWLNLKTKEGAIKVDLTFSAPYFSKWLSLHPDPRPDQYLFCARRKGVLQAWGYNAAKLLLLRLKEKTKIKKRLHTHIFRRSGANFWKQMGVSDQVIERRGDWTWGSKALRTSYLSSNESEAHEASSAALKGTKPKTAVSIFTPIICVVCQWQNLPDTEYCANCHHKLSVKEIAKESSRMAEMQQQLAKMTAEQEKLKAEMKQMAVYAAQGTMGIAKQRAKKRAAKKRAE